MSKARPWAVATCLLGAAAVFGGALMSAQAGADRTAAPSEAESLSVIRQNAPAVARAIAADKELRNVVGADKWPLALHRLAEFSKRTDADHKDALRIIGDTVTRVKNPVAEIKLDGDPAEWSGSMPSPEWASAQFAKAETWLGAAAVVRQDRLYLMAGLPDAAQHFAQPDNEMRVSIDCRGDQAWDVRLLLSWRQGTWATTQLPLTSNTREGKPLPAAQGAVGTAAEASLAIRNFVPVSEAKPLWTIVLEAHSEARNVKGMRWLPTPDIPVLNENAREGVAAWPYVRTFLCLCADKPLAGFELTAAAIAIMSSTMYNDSNGEVRKRIRADNAEFLEFARSIDAWQKQADTEYRLTTYPLEAQLAWAARFAHGSGNYETSRGPKKKNNAENYYWVSTSVETLKTLKALAIKEELTDVSLARCGKRIDDWVRFKQVEPYKNPTTTPPSGKPDLTGAGFIPAVAGRINTAPLRRMDLTGEALEAREKELKASDSHHAETILKQIETHGYIVGSRKCGQHNQFSQNLMRAVGIAPLGFWIKRSRGGPGDHAWPAWYDPAKNVWLSYQGCENESKSKIWYSFVCKRRPLFTYAAEAAISTNERKKLHIGKNNTGPFPWVFCREMQGFEVGKLSHAGIPTKEIREWMLTPGF